MTLADLILNLRTINCLNEKARQLVGDNAVRIIKHIERVAYEHDLSQSAFDWYVSVNQGKPCAAEGGIVQCDCYEGVNAGFTAGFICDCVNAVRRAVRERLPSFQTDLQAIAEQRKAEIERLRKALRKASDTLRLTLENAEDVMQPHLAQEIAHCGSAVEKALRGEK